MIVGSKSLRCGRKWPRTDDHPRYNPDRWGEKDYTRVCWELRGLVKLWVLRMETMGHLDQSE